MSAVPNRDPSPPGNAPVSVWVKLSYDAGVESLKAQREELNGMRTRGLAFTALTITASAFLVGQGLSAPDRNFWFYCLAVVGSLGFLALAGAIVALIGPWRKFRFILEPDKLMSWLPDGSSRTEEMALRRLAMNVVPGMLSDNESSLRVIRSIYWSTLVTAIITLGVWLLVVWIYA